jgi:hypothetical protein
LQPMRIVEQSISSSSTQTARTGNASYSARSPLFLS